MQRAKAADHRTGLLRQSVGGDEVTDRARSEGLDATTTESLAEPHSDLHYPLYPSLPHIVSPLRLMHHFTLQLAAGLSHHHTNTQSIKMQQQSTPLIWLVMPAGQLF